MTEFRYVGERTSRPDPASTGEAEWRAYLYTRRNPRGWAAETWYHGTGCRQHFTIERHTLTNETRPAKELDERAGGRGREAVSTTADRSATPAGGERGGGRETKGSTS